MKPNILFTTSKGISSKFVFHTICDTFESLYERYKDDYNIIFLSHYKEKTRLSKLIVNEGRSVFFDEVLLLSEFTNNLDYTTANHWVDIYDQMDVSRLPKIEKIIEFGSALSEGAYLQRGALKFSKCFLTKAQFKYISVRKIKEHFTFICKASIERNAELEHYILDPQELDYNEIDYSIPSYKRYFPYTSESQNFSRDDYFLDHYKKNRNDFDKEYDFVFGYTILTKDRASSKIDDIEDLLSHFNVKLFKRDKYNNIDTFVKKDIYLSYIKKSRFTLIMPSYDTSTFSVYRYIESIYNDCLPLILDTVDISEAKKSIYIPEELIVSIESIPDAIKNIDYNKILTDIKHNL